MTKVQIVITLQPKTPDEKRRAILLLIAALRDNPPTPPDSPAVAMRA